MFRTILLFTFLLVYVISSHAQSLPNSREPGTIQKESYAPVKVSKKKSYNLNAEFDRLVEEQKVRMKKNVKKYKRMARKMKKPQYSDPMYFGHKRKPKKRKVGKRKLCKECLIVH